jgi:hypothetical protein
MAALARRVLIEAERAFETAPALAAAMEPHLGRRYSDSSIYAYTNERSVPPGDVLLAAARAAGISLDEKLGLRAGGGIEYQIDELWAKVAELRACLARLEGRLEGEERGWGGGEEPEGTKSGADRRAQRRRWARRSRSSPPAPSSWGERAAGRSRQLRG